MGKNKCKVTICGNSAVGKTCLINRITVNCFNESIITTITPSNESKTINLGDEDKIDFDITDTVGQERFRSLNTIFFNRADIILLLFDLTNKRSFDEIKEYWYNSVTENAKKDQSIIST